MESMKRFERVLIKHVHVAKTGDDTYEGQKSNTFQKHIGSGKCSFRWFSKNRFLFSFKWPAGEQISAVSFISVWSTKTILSPRFYLFHYVTRLIWIIFRHFAGSTDRLDRTARNLVRPTTSVRSPTRDDATYHVRQSHSCAPRGLSFYPSRARRRHPAAGPKHSRPSRDRRAFGRVPSRFVYACTQHTPEKTYSD